MSQQHEDEIPIATDDESTIRGSPEAGNVQQNGDGYQSDSLPSSSPISVCFTEDDELIGVDGRGRSFSPIQLNSFFNVEGPPSRSHAGPGAMMFDDHESNGYEDGEIEDSEGEDQGPPPNQEMSRTESSVFGGAAAEDDDYDSGELSTARPTSNYVPTASKRNWAGSPVSEELNRSSRRPKRESTDVHQHAHKFPSIQEMSNPWGAVSTPRRSVSTYTAPSTPSNFANTSGQPPTPFSVGSSVRDNDGFPTRGRSSQQGEKPKAARSRGTRPPARDDRERAVADSGLLEAVDRRGKPNRSLQDVLEDASPGFSRPSRVLSGPGGSVWPGGYAPRHWPSGEHGDRESRRPAVEEREPSRGSKTRDTQESFFSAIPNTKAWAYKARRHQEYDDIPEQREDVRMSEEYWPSQQEPTYGGHGHGDPFRPHEQEREHTMTHVRSWSRPGSSSPSPETRNQKERDGRGMDELGDVEDWSMPMEDYGAIPTAMAEDAEAEDTPVLLEAPKDGKWATFFDDPETLLRGQSGQWTRVIWGSSDPIVLFTVFNYKFTKDGTINKHIQASVTALTTFLTGERKFFVVPPDPDQTRELKGRDLPFVWVIRGLTEAGVKTMTSLRAISTRAVSIITYPRSLSNPRWVCGLVNFLTRDVESIREAVLQVLRGDDMIRLLEDLTTSSRQLANIPQHRRVEYVINSLRIRITEAEDEDFVANVYIFPPTDDLRKWRGWADAMRRSKYNVFLNGTGSARKIFWAGRDPRLARDRTPASSWDRRGGELQNAAEEATRNWLVCRLKEGLTDGSDRDPGDMSAKTAETGEEAADGGLRRCEEEGKVEHHRRRGRRVASEEAGARSRTGGTSGPAVGKED
ncbi:hypothetical protein OH76DRAFT_1419505 [Lentinus brumalis]|uniref:Uncharacterized protein n=1 Tax=Lentinus brumalis TaxID=2498619 RepID=A0A371D575_9APHY|nr:hypothetical protein OH76DRAFT_1419505 [Polyporus brumalis]